MRGDVHGRHRLPPRGLGAHVGARLPPRGLGANLSTLLQSQSLGLQGAVQSALAGYPGLSSALSQGWTTASSLQPAASLAAALASGNAPSEATVIAGMAAVAGAINPLAGAAVAAMGATVAGVSTALQSIFQALGLYSPPQPSWTYAGFLRLDVDPIPDGIADPKWLRIGNSVDLTNAYYYGVPSLGHPPVSPSAAQIASESTNPYGGPVPPVGIWTAALNRRYLPWVAGTWAYINQCVVQNTACAGGYPAKCNVSAPATGTIQNPQCGNAAQSAALAKLSDFQAIATTQQQLQTGAAKVAALLHETVNAAPIQTYPSLPSPFEQFFCHLLSLNFEFWANGQAYLPARTLLAASALAWNQLHAGPLGLIYPGESLGDDAAKTANGANGIAGGNYYSLPRAVLSPQGANIGNTAPFADTGPLAVNTGAPIAFGTPTSAALIALGTAAVGAAGLAVYSWATQQAISTIWKRIATL